MASTMMASAEQLEIPNFIGPAFSDRPNMVNI